MRRTDKEPTQSELVSLIVENPIGRSADLASMAETMLSTEGGMTYFLDGDWGSGKTFFVKQLKVVLEALNPNIDNDDMVQRALGVPEIAALQSHIVSNGGCDAGAHGECEAFQSPPYLPIYYNAWESDHWDDPLPPIVQTIAWQAGGSGKVDSKNPFEKFEEITESILKASGLGLVSEACKTISGKDLLQQYEDRMQIRHYIQQLIEEALDGRDEKMLLIIDELDRCRPVFALKLLEQVKNLFDGDKLVVLYAVNMSELSKTVEHQYGSGFDGARYLNRFYDMEFSLFPPAGGTYLAYAGVADDAYRAHAIAHEMQRALRMSLRDQNRYASEMVRADSLKDKENIGNLTEATFVENALLPLLLALKVARPAAYRSITSMEDGDGLFTYGCMSEGFMDYLDVIVDNRRRQIAEVDPDFGLLDEDPNFLSEEESEGVRNRARRLILDGAITLMFDTDTRSSAHRKAYRLVCDGSFGYRRLDVIARRLLG